MLQGSFDTVSFDEVLGFLASSSKTGVLRISGDRGTGSVWVEDGQMVAAETTQGGDEATMEEVVFELLRFTSGTFAFEFDETNPNASSPMAIEGVLAQANKLLVEWRGIETVVPGLDHRITPSPSLPADQVTITEDEWSTILAVGSNSSVEEVTTSLHLGQLEGLRRLKGLIERKLVLISDPQSDQLPAKTEMEAPESEESSSDVAEEPLKFSAPDPAPASASAEVPPPASPSTRRLSAKRAEVAPAPAASTPAPEAPTSVFDAPAPPAPPVPEPAKVEETMSDPFIEGEARPPIPPPPPPMPSAPVPAAPAVSAEVPPPPAPPSPAEIAKFGNTIEDASSIDPELVETAPEGETSLLMRYLQSEG